MCYCCWANKFTDRIIFTAKGCFLSFGYVGENIEKIFH